MPPVSTETDTRDRVIRTETEVEALSQAVGDLNKKVDRLLTYVEQARGAKLAFGGVAMLFGFGGGAVSGKLAAVIMTLFNK